MNKFRGRLAFLSNFHNCEVTIWGIEFPSSEHAFMAGKTLDHNIRLEISKIETPGKAKRFGRTIELRPDWNIVRTAIMLEVLLAKFSQNPDLLAKLKEVDDGDLVEINEWGDRFWGIDGTGLNHLGRLLGIVKTAL